MTQKSSFFNSVAGDRKYQASDFAEYFNSLVTNGVFPNPATNLQVLANGNMTVTLKAGPAWIKGYHYQNDSDLILPVTVADGVLKRIDRIALRMDTIARNITAVVKKGAFASTPVAPTLQRDADAYELAMADVYIANGATSIVQSNVTDLRLNTTLCGWVNSLIQADTTAIFNQYLDWYTAKQLAYNADFTDWTTDKKALYDSWYTTITGTAETDVADFEAQFQMAFTTWFDGIKGQLMGDIAANLTNQVMVINGLGGNVEKANKSALDSASASIADLAGAGRTSETVKGNALALEEHKDDNSGHIPHLGTTTNSTNAYSLTTTKVILANQKFTVKINSASTGAATLNISSIGSAKGIKKAGGLDAILKVGAYTLFYDGVNFQLLGEGGDYGTAGQAQVLEGYTVGRDDGVKPGTIPTLGVVSAIAQDVSGTSIRMRPPMGYSTGTASTLVVASDSDFIPANFLATKNVFGMQGAIPDIGGSAPSVGVGRWPDGGVAVYFPPGYYHDGFNGNAETKVTVPQLQSIEGNLLPANIPQGKSIFGLTGTLKPKTSMSWFSVPDNYYIIAIAEGTGFWCVVQGGKRYAYFIDNNGTLLKTIDKVSTSYSFLNISHDGLRLYWFASSTTIVVTDINGTLIKTLTITANSVNGTLSENGIAIFHGSGTNGEGTTIHNLDGVYISYYYLINASAYVITLQGALVVGDSFVNFGYFIDNSGNYYTLNGLGRCQIYKSVLSYLFKI